MEKRELTLLGFVVALAVGLSFTLSQAACYAQETTASTPVTQGVAKDSKKGTHKSGKKMMKGMKNKKAQSNEVKPDMATPQVVK